MRLARLVVVALALGAAPATAQAPTVVHPQADPYEVHAALDLVVGLDGTIAGSTPTTSTLTTGQLMWITGWAFECRSGLQPATQRQGQFFASFTRRVGGQFGEVEHSTVLTPIVVVPRPDVAVAYQSRCQSIGPNVGYWAMITPPDEWGLWTLSISVMTTDGAGNPAWSQEIAQKDVFVWPSYASPAPTAGRQE